MGMSEGYPSDWDSRRRETYKRDNYTCQNCGAKGGPHGDAELQAHHVVPKKDGGTHKKSNLKTLCKGCHDAIHHNNKKAPTSGDNRKTTTSSSDNHKTTNSRFDDLRERVEKNEVHPSIKSKRSKKKKCPFCESYVNHNLRCFISHWAKGYRCDYSHDKDEPEGLEFGVSWDEITEMVKEQQKHIYPSCPYCGMMSRGRSAKKFISHWTSGGCKRAMKSPPAEKPDKIDEELWEEINEKWDEFTGDKRDSPQYPDYTTNSSTSTNGLSIENLKKIAGVTLIIIVTYLILHVL